MIPNNSTKCIETWKAYKTGLITLTELDEQMNTLLSNQLKLEIRIRKNFKPTTKGRGAL